MFELTSAAKQLQVDRGYGVEAVTDNVLDSSAEYPQCDDQTKTTKSPMMLPFVPGDVIDQLVLCHWGQSVLRGFVEYQIITKISRMVPLIPGPLSRWILELEDKMKSVHQHHRADTGPAIVAGGTLPLRDVRAQSTQGGHENVDNGCQVL